MFARGALLTSFVVTGLAPGCGEPAARVTLVPIDQPCGRPAGATGVRVIAYGTAGEVTRAVGLDETVDITDFPIDTQQLGVEVVIGGGVVGAIGKTAPLPFAELATGDAIPIFMAPPGGFCPTVTPMTEPRTAPLLARAGAGALIIGGRDGAGGWLTTAEFYDPATATFQPLEVPQVLGENGFAGTALATLPDGRVAISGGPQPVITLFDPATLTFSESVLIEGRAFHAAVAIGDDEVLVAGGCRNVEAGMCAGLVRNSSSRFDTGDLSVPLAGPTLRIGRLGGAMFETGLQVDGARGFVIAGGAAPPGADPASADQFTLATDAVPVSGVFSQAAQLDGGAVLTAFAPAGDPPDGSAAVIVPGVGTARPVTRAPDLAGVRVIGLEDGRVLGVGGEPTGRILLYDPTIDRWQLEAPDPATAPGLLAGASLLRLADGSVLVVGGAHAREAWIYRPSLVGPQSGSVTVVPGGATSTVLTAVDPATVTRGADWQLAATDGLARALVGGPRMITGSVQATVRVRAGAVALLAQHAGVGAALVAELAPGTPARLVEYEAGVARTLCTGAIVPALDPEVAAIVRLSVRGVTARIQLDEVELAACTIASAERGAWGVAALGGGARVTVDTVTVAR